MLAVDLQLAPTPTLVRYLAVFQRFLDAVVDYTHDGDKLGMLLGGWLADALHNVPGMLWHCDPNAWHNPAGMDAWMNEFPERMREKSAPERLVADSRRILSAESGTQALGLRDDVADLDLAPLPKMCIYLNLLYDACLSMRFLRNVRRRSSPAIWQGVEQAWSEMAEQADAQAHFNGVIASVLRPVPAALVRWGSFDAEQFYNEALKAADLFPQKDRETWISYFMAMAKPSRS